MAGCARFGGRVVSGDTDADVVLRLRSTDDARRAFRRAALAYAARKLRALGYDGAAFAIEGESK